MPVGIRFSLFPENKMPLKRRKCVYACKLPLAVFDLLCYNKMNYADNTMDPSVVSYIVSFC